MGAPYIARAPKKVLVRIPRNEGYTTVPSGMATLRLIPSPLDKPTDTTENPHTEPRAPASPLDRPNQFTTGLPVPSTYTPNRYTESPQGENTTTTSPVVTQASPASPTVISSGGAPASTVHQQQLGHGEAGDNTSSNSRSVVLQATPPRGQQQQASATLYQRSSSSGHHGPGGEQLAPAAVATTQRSTPLHYQGHFTAITGRLHQATATPGRQQHPPPPFTDFIAGQVWRALMMASQQQQQQLQQQQQQHASGFARRPVGGKRIRDMASTHQEDADEEPSRKLSRVSQPQPQRHGLQDAAPTPPSPSPHILYTAPSLTASHTTFHTTMPTPPTTPPTTQQNCNTDFHTTIPTPPTTPPSTHQYCNTSAYDTAHLPLTPPPRLLSSHPHQPLGQLSPPALHLPIMFPPVFPQSMTSTKGGPQQQFSLSRKSSSSNSSSGPVTVSGCGGGGQGAAPPPHHLHHQAASQLTAAPVGLSSTSSVTNPLLSLHHHHHPIHAALIQPTQGGGRVQADGSGAHVGPAVAAMTVVGGPGYGGLTAVPPTEPMTVHVAAQRTVQQSLPTAYISTNVKTSSNRTNSSITDSITSTKTLSHSMMGQAGVTVGSGRGTQTVVNCDVTNTSTFTSHCT